MKLRAFCEVLDKLAPTRFAAKWDNVGLLVEPADVVVQKVLLTNDLTPKVLQEAINFNANVVISYHPPLFVSFKRISQDNWKDRLVTEALKHNIAIYSPHTAHDAWAKGVNSWLIQGLLENSENHVPISPTIDEREMYEISGSLLYPEDWKSFRKNFNKTQFCDATNTISGIISKRDVLKISQLFGDRVEDMKYVQLGGNFIDGFGMRRKATLKEPVSLADIIERTKKHLKMEHLRLVLGKDQTLESKISSVAVCAGSGASILTKAGKVDLWVTGEMGHHEALDAQENNVLVLLAEHSNTERGFLESFKEMIMENDSVRKKGIEFKVSEFDKDPISVC